MPFDGFSDKDFRVFTIPDFAGRMAAIRAQIQPKLFALAGELAPHLRSIAGGEAFPHVAKHMRRTVNPPEDTWVAFGPEKRGYKRNQHFKIAISRHCVRFLFEIGPEYADKGKWTRAWQREIARLAPKLKKASGLGWYKNEHDEEPAALLEHLSPAEISRLALELTRRKDGQLVLGRRLDQAEILRLKPDAFTQAALATFRDLAPLYKLR
ncbi:MAG: DUF1054 domain-containing protein [Acidobacteria bacterium]|nr:DUF1054 domain-containing protein [Acidobacteriota bacterium]